jgi:hypothetical protein
LEAQGGGAFYIRYDGGAIGEHIPDAMQSLAGMTASVGMPAGVIEHLQNPPDSIDASEVIAYGRGSTVGGNYAYSHAFRNFHQNTRVADETRVASISAYVCIKY